MAQTHPPALCSKFHRASELIGRRWTGAIIFVLLKATCRFAALRAAIPEITDRMLSDRLQELEAEGIVVRTVIPATPVRVEYALTEKGRALAGAMDAIAAWAQEWSADEGASDAGTAPPEAPATAPAASATPEPAAVATAGAPVSRRQRQDRGAAAPAGEA